MQVQAGEEVIASLPCNEKKVATLLKQWIKDSIVQLSFVNQTPSQIKVKDPNFCTYHRRKGHALDQCLVFRNIFDKKLQDEEIIL